MIWDEGKEALMKKVTRLAVTMLVVAPIIHLGIAFVLPVSSKSGGAYDMMLYILLIVAVCQPLVLPIVERMQLAAYAKNQQSRMRPDQLLISVGTVKYAFVEAIFLYGLVVYILMGSFVNMFYFYGVGIVWSVVYWPRRATLENFFQRIETHVPSTPA